MPIWRAATAYLAGAIVTETTGLRMWRCTTAGTSGNSEPAWPAAAPWTVADGTVVWARNTTFRRDVHEGIIATLTAWMAANPTLLRRVWAARPASFTLGDLPCAVIGNMSETITVMNGVRRRQMDGFTVDVVDRAPDGQEAGVRMNALVDGLMDYVSDAYHSASGTSIVEPISVQDGDSGLIAEGSNVYWYSNVIMFRAYIVEGRT